MNKKETEHFEQLEKLLLDNDVKLLVLLKTPRFGDTVENLMGDEFDLSQFAVIYSFEDDVKYYAKDGPHNKIYEWEWNKEKERRNQNDYGTELDFMKFAIGPDNSTDIDNLIYELKCVDAYEIVKDNR